MLDAVTCLAPDIAVVVPCYNERPNVSLVVAKLAQALDGIAWEVIFVDDNSPRGTWPSWTATCNMTRRGCPKC